MSKYISVMLCVLGVVLASFGAKKYFYANPQKPDTKVLNTPRGMSDWSWTKAPWTASDAPYIAIRQAVDEAIANGKNRNDLIREAGNSFIDSNNDSKLAFKWAYAYYGNQAFDAPHDRQLARQIIFALVWAIKDKPVSYEYARMEFLVARAFGNKTMLLDLGTKLLQRNSNDIIVKYQAARALAYGNEKQKEKSEEYANFFSKKYPNSYGSHALWAVIYFVHSNAGLGNQTIANKAINESRKALSFLPKTSAYNGERNSMTAIEDLINNNRKTGIK